ELYLLKRDENNLGTQVCPIENFYEIWYNGYNQREDKLLRGDITNYHKTLHTYIFTKVIEISNCLQRMITTTTRVYNVKAAWRHKFPQISINHFVELMRLNVGIIKKTRYQEFQKLFDEPVLTICATLPVFDDHANSYEKNLQMTQELSNELILEILGALFQETRLSASRYDPRSETESSNRIPEARVTRNDIFGITNLGISICVSHCLVSAISEVCFFSTKASPFLSTIFSSFMSLVWVTSDGSLCLGGISLIKDAYRNLATTYHNLPRAYIIANKQSNLTQRMAKDISIKLVNMNTIITSIIDEESGNIDEELDNIDNEPNDLDSNIIENIMNSIDT
ncbi:3333_t:CDS:2, partial [Racocetra persica]